MEKSDRIAIDEKLGVFLQTLGMDRVDVEKTREYYQERLRREESKRLSRISSLLIAVWQIPEILAKLTNGHSLVIDGETGEIYHGRVNTDKLQKIGKKLPSRVSHAIDTAQFTPEYLKTTSLANPVIVAGFRSAWELALKYPKNYDYPIVELFLEKLVDTPMSEISYTVIVGEFGDVWTKITIKNWPVSVTFYKTGHARSYEFRGETFEF